MLIGKVKWFDNARGYGFIDGKGGPDVFVHFTAIQMGGYRQLKREQQVMYNCVDGPKGLQAQNVRPL